MKPAVLLLIIAFLTSFSTNSRAQASRIVIDSIRIESGNLMVDFHADSLLSSRLLAGMQRGITSSARFRVQLWRKRSLFLSGLVAEREYEIKATFDLWEQQYLMQTWEERRLTRSLELVRANWEQHRNLLLADSSKLGAKTRYRVSVEVLVEPVSRESLQEIRGWLGGEIKKTPQPDSTGSPPPENSRGLQDRLLDAVIDLTGLGERMITARSETFRVTEDGRIEFEK